MNTQTFGFPNGNFAFSVAVMHAERGTPCKLFKAFGVWYVSI
jgi:hypothetical protein